MLIIYVEIVEALKILFVVRFPIVAVDAYKVFVCKLFIEPLDKTCKLLTIKGSVIDARDKSAESEFLSLPKIGSKIG